MVAMPACLGRIHRLVFCGASSCSHSLRHKTVVEYQQSCDVLLQAKIARDKFSAKDWVRPGKVLRDEGLRPKHPVVVVPGESGHP